MPPNADICRARRLYEPVAKEDGLPLGMITFEHVDPSTTITLQGPGGEPFVRDHSGRPQRPVVVDYPPDGVGGRDPCWASFEGPLGNLRIHHEGRLLAEVAALPDTPGVRAG